MEQMESKLLDMLISFGSTNTVWKTTDLERKEIVLSWYLWSNYRQIPTNSNICWLKKVANDQIIVNRCQYSVHTPLFTFLILRICTRKYKSLQQSVSCTERIAKYQHHNKYLQCHSHKHGCIHFTIKSNNTKIILNVANDPTIVDCCQKSMLCNVTQVNLLFESKMCSFGLFFD